MKLLLMCLSHSECRFGDDRVYEHKGYSKYADGEGVTEDSGSLETSFWQRIDCCLRRYGSHTTAREVRNYRWLKGQHNLAGLKKKIVGYT